MPVSSREVLTDRIHKIENLRVSAASDDVYDDERYQEALSQTVDVLAEQEIDSSEDWRQAGICHLHLMAATIQQSRAKHTLQSDEDIIEAVDDAKTHLEKALPIGERLTEKGYLQSVDNTPFIWSAELNRGIGRILMRHPQSETKDFETAEKHFRQAQEAGLEVYQNEIDSGELCGAGLMVSATARVEALMARKKTVESSGKNWDKKEHYLEILKAGAELEIAEKYFEYVNADRRNETLRRIYQEL
jgi:hypothetical protein